MPAQRRGLGRGLGALIPAGPPGPSPAGHAGGVGVLSDISDRSAQHNSPVSTFLFRQEPPVGSNGTPTSEAGAADPAGVGYFAQLQIPRRILYAVRVCWSR